MNANWASFFIGVASNTAFAVVVWLLSYLTNLFYGYTIVLVHKKNWNAFQKVAPDIHKKITVPK